MKMTFALSVLGPTPGNDDIVFDCFKQKGIKWLGQPPVAQLWLFQTL